MASSIHIVCIHMAGSVCISTRESREIGRLIAMIHTGGSFLQDLGPSGSATVALLIVASTSVDLRIDHARSRFEANAYILHTICALGGTPENIRTSMRKELPLPRPARSRWARSNPATGVSMKNSG